MKYTACWITGIAAAIMMAGCITLITIGAMMRPGQPAVLGVVVMGMMCGVAAATFGAISAMTYQTPYERSHWRAINEIDKSALPRASTVARYSPSDGLEPQTHPTTPGTA